MNEIILRINLHGLKNETHVQFNEGIDPPSGPSGPSGLFSTEDIKRIIASYQENNTQKIK
jgi:hypothetical protein